jgi:hypothetical protein
MNKVIFRPFQSTDINALQHLMTTTVEICYSTFPQAYRQHWMDDHHSTDQILQEARASGDLEALNTRTLTS